MLTGQAPAFARTNTPIAAGPIIVYLTKLFGLDLTVEQALLLAGIISSLYYALGRLLETVNPKFGYILGIPKQPAYSHQPPPSPGPGEEVAAVVVPEGTFNEDGHADIGLLELVLIVFIAVGMVFVLMRLY